MITRREIAFAFAVTLASLDQPAGAVDAQSFDGVARPATAVAVACKAALRRKHPLAPMRRNVALEIGLVAEQAKAVLDLPLDTRRTGHSKLRVGSRHPPVRGRERNKAEVNQLTHDICRDGIAIINTDGAEI